MSGTLALRHALDPAAFFSYAGRRLGRHPYAIEPWQQRALRSESKRKCIVAARQVGKTSVLAALALHKALFFEGSLVLVVAPTERQSKIAFARVARLFRAYGGQVDTLSARRLGLEFGNGSMIEALPGGNPGGVQGYSADLVILDEAGFATTELFNALSPSLAATDGDLVLAGRPNGKRGPLWDIYSSGEGWDKLRITAEQSGLVSRRFLEAERQNMDAASYAENYLAEFIEPSGSYFAREKVLEALSDEIEPLELEGVDLLCPSTSG